MQTRIANGIDTVAVVGAVVGAAVLLWWARRPLPVTGPQPARSVLLHPWTLFLLTGALAFGNQIVFNAYVLAVHGGDPSFIRARLGPAYFAMDLDFPLVRPIAGAFGREAASFWLAPSLLRVNAVLELPFAVFAYLAIAHLFDRGAVRFLLRSPLGWLGATSFTVVLCLVEILLWNPWTTSDLWMRGVGLVLMVPILWGLGRRERGAPCFPEEDGRPRSLMALLLAMTGAIAMAGALLVLYDLTLLYNLGHTRKLGVPLIGLVLLGTASALVVPRLDAQDKRVRRGAPPPGSVAAMTSVASTFALLFFVPSLAVRYGLSLRVSVAVGLATLLAGVAWGLARAARRPEVRGGRWLVGLTCAALAGAGAVFLARPLLRLVLFPEAALLGYAVIFLGPFVFTWRALESLGLDSRRG